MGEYYSWINVEKREYISPYDFDYGNKRTESLVRGNELLSALYELLSAEWMGDHVLWMSDEKGISKNIENETLRVLYDQTVRTGYPGDPFDTVIESYTDISKFFKAAEKQVCKKIELYLYDRKNDGLNAHNEYGITVDNPFDGLFLREGCIFRYVINHTKKVCFSFDRTKILYMDQTECDYADPLPILMSYGNGCDTGKWAGDIIGTADEMPTGYELLSKIFLDW